MNNDNNHNVVIALLLCMCSQGKQFTLKMCRNSLHVGVCKLFTLSVLDG
jgi:hypothetical protein